MKPGGLESALTRVQHHFAHIICSTMHVHLSETECFEAIAVGGNIAEVRKLRDQLAAKKGIKMVKVTFFLFELSNYFSSSILSRAFRACFAMGSGTVTAYFSSFKAA